VRVLVTGASGFIGWHVARLLLERGYDVRALVRPASRVRELDLEQVSGDLRDAESLRRAVAGCERVFHVAADYRLWARRPQELFESNVTGTRNLLEAARASGVGRVVYTSTVGCIGIPHGGIGDESQPVAMNDMQGAYKRSKFEAERAALESARRGDPVVIVNPTAPVGDHDVKPTPTGRIVLDFLQGRMPAFIDTGLNLVDVRDAAEGHLLAAEKGVPGQRYILGCENLTLEEILRRLAKLTGRKAPAVKLPRAPIDAVRMARKKMWVSHDKAKRELGFAPGPVDAALSRAIQWFESRGARGHDFVW
jgi:dihydroflavonol-4-reductase